MDCSDMIIGAGRGSTHGRVADYYTRDRSTPRPDSEYQGLDSISESAAYESNGKTYIYASRQIRTNDVADHDFADESMTFIWAVGQRQGQYSHQPVSAIETGTASIQEFYKDDELKYHGKANMQRGSFTANLIKKLKRVLTFEIKVLKWNYTTALEDPSTEHFRALNASIVTNVVNFFSSNEFFQMASIKSLREGSVIVGIELIFSTPAGRSLNNETESLRDVIRSGFITSLAVDPTYFTLTSAMVERKKYVDLSIVLMISLGCSIFAAGALVVFIVKCLERKRVPVTRVNNNATLVQSFQKNS